MKVFQTDENAINALLQMLRQANTIEDFINETTEIGEFNFQIQLSSNINHIIYSVPPSQQFICSDEMI